MIELWWYYKKRKRHEKKIHLHIAFLVLCDALCHLWTLPVKRQPLDVAPRLRTSRSIAKINLFPLKLTLLCCVISNIK
jgi:hypothetical protein